MVKSCSTVVEFIVNDIKTDVESLQKLCQVLTVYCAIVMYGCVYAPCLYVSQVNCCKILGRSYCFRSWLV